MNIESITRVLKDPTSSQKLVKRVLKDNNMQIVHDFSPVKSEYKIKIGDKNRVTLTLNGDEFVQKEERFAYGKWRPTIEMRVKDTAQAAEEAMINAIEFIKFCAGKKLGNKIISSFVDNLAK